MRSGVAPAASTISISRDRGDIEARAEVGQELEHLRRRVGLHGVEHARVGQRLGEGLIVLADDVEVDDEAGPVVGRLRAGIHGCARSLALSRLRRLRGAAKAPAVTLGRALCATSTPAIAALVRSGASPVPHCRQRRTSLFGDPAFAPARPKSPLRRCFKPRPARRAGCAGFASGCRSSSEEADPSSGGCPASCPDPTDRHVATGTCEFGRRAT